ncbi:MAG TPA: HK97 family phage prohead protease [Lacipirellulaceae bacterium]|nr:HK97 family phage prohead protease [Lacipirellulaceae bacterium]
MSKREIKSAGAPQFKDVNGRTVYGIFSVYGVIDSYGDIVMPGAFSKTLRERGDKIVHLWQHDMWSPPTAAIDELVDLTREQLPTEILRDYPEATGGMGVKRTYLTTPRGDEVLTNITSSVPLEMSFAFRSIKYDFGEVDERPVRYLRELALFETSDVLWGANPATIASSGKSGLPLDMLELHLQQALERDGEFTLPLDLLGVLIGRAKAGSRHSAADVKLINAIHNAAIDLGCTNCKGVIGDDDEEDGKVDALLLGTDPVPVTGFWLRSHNESLEVLAHVDGAWRSALVEPFVFTAEQSVDRKAALQPGDPVSDDDTSNIDDEETSRAAHSRALTLARRARILEMNLKLSKRGYV